MHPDPFHPDSLALPSNGKPLAIVPVSKRPPRHRAGEPFVRGPIPWRWLCAAGGLPARTLAVALVLWYLAGLKTSRVVQWSPAKAEAMGLDRHAAHRGLRALERARLVSVDRRRGRCPIVTILELKGEHGPAASPP